MRTPGHVINDFGQGDWSRVIEGFGLHPMDPCTKASGAAGFSCGLSEFERVFDPMIIAMEIGVGTYVLLCARSVLSGQSHRIGRVRT